MDDLQNRIKKNLEKNIKNNEYDLFKQTLLAKINIIDKDDLDYINIINIYKLRGNAKIHKKIILFMLDIGFKYNNKLLLQNLYYKDYEKFLIKLYKKYNVKFNDNDFIYIENECLINLVKSIIKKEGFTDNILKFYNKHYKLLDLTLPKIYKKLFKLDLNNYSRLDLIIKAKKNDYTRKINLISELTPFYKDIGDIIYEYHL